ncbi:class F sortase [Bacillus sp. OV322]|uniref:class F sortase n=1 Tax=Bacillus sp. OV322 TaxID=1882764 RepID=UPI0015A5BBC7|nr:class F sortase [Bacillus sp. OV322]
MKRFSSIMAAACLSGLLLAGCQGTPVMDSTHSTHSHPTSPEKKKQDGKKMSKDPIFKEFVLSEEDAASFVNKRIELERRQIEESEGLIPSRIKIPSLKIDTKVEKAGILKNGEMDVPKDDKHAAWFEPGTIPGELGSAVIDGHVDNKTGPAVFFKLKDLKAGDEIILYDQKSKKMTFTVQKKKSYPYKSAPIKEIFGKRDMARLNVITCTGLFDRSKGTHQERLVVYSTLKENVKDQKTLLKKPESPPDLTISGTFISWHAVRQDTIVGYRIYRKDQNGEYKYAKSVSALQRKSYTDSSAPKHQYYVTAVDLFGQESKPSKTIPEDMAK